MLKATPWVLAEIGHNHQGSVELCENMIQIAAQSGALGVKLQKRDNRSLFTKEFFESAYTGSNAYASTYGAHREKLEFNLEQYRHLRRIAELNGLAFVVTAFDQPSVEFCVELGVDAIKIASADVAHLPLINSAIDSRLPLLISTGGAELTQVQRLYEMVTQAQVDAAFLQCTSKYPTPIEDANVSVVETYRRLFPAVTVGFSDHTLSHYAALAAIALGAQIIEKHFTLDKSARGSDHHMSITPEELKELCFGISQVSAALGSSEKRRLADEAQALVKMEKSLVSATDLAPGYVLGRKDIDVKSPGGGLLPDKIDDIIGCTLRVAKKVDEKFSFEDFTDG